MTPLLMRSALLAGLGIAAMTLPAFALSRATIDEGTLFKSKTAQLQFAASPYDCFTDDGYGRKRPCSAGFKKKKTRMSK